MIKRIVKNKLIVEAASYSIATAINRGLVLLALPFLGKSLSLEEFGLWTLSQTIISIGAPLFSLNGASGILREGVGNHQAGFTVFDRFVGITFKILILTTVVLLFIPRNWIFYTLLLVIIDAFASLITMLYRSEDKHILYFAVVFTKLIALVGAIMLTKADPGLLNILFYQTVLGATLLAPFFIHIYVNERPRRVELNFKSVLIFCTALLPHGFSQWIISGSDRIIIKSMLGDTPLGNYSLAYTLALSMMLINSGLGMTVGVDVIKNYELWQKTARRPRAIFLYSLLFLIACAGLVGVSVHFRTQLPFLNNLSVESLRLLPWILNGMYFLGIYLFYINYLNYLRESILLSSITMGTAVINVLLTIALIPSFGIMGGAISTFVSYFAMMAASMGFSVKKANLFGGHFIVDLIVISVTVGINFLILQFIISFAEG